MKLLSEERIYEGVSMGAAILAAVLVRKIVKTSWKKVKKKDPPENPASPETAWGEAIIWTVATGITVAMARLLAKRGAAEGWKKVLGAYPLKIHQSVGK